MLSMYHPYYEKGGISRISYEIGRSLVGMGHEVYFPTLVPSGGEIVDKSGMHVIKCKPGFGIYPETVAHTARFLHDNHKLLSKIDIIHSHFVASTAPLLYRKARLIDFVPIVHGQYDVASTEMSALLSETTSNSKKVKRIIRYSAIGLCESINLRLSDAVITEDFETRRKIVNQSRTFGSKTVVIPSGVNTDHYVSTPSSAHALKQNIKVPSSSKVVVYVGRIAPRKGILVLLKAMVEVAKEERDVLLVIAGSLDDLNFMNKLKTFAKQLDVLQRTIWCVNVPEEDLPNYYSIADVVVIPSLSEGIPITLFEAMSVGSPVVISDLPQIRKVEPSILGVVRLFKPGSEGELAESIILSIRSKDKEQFSAKARNLALNFDWSIIARRVAGVYHQVLDGDLSREV
jgi:glycosyltransferase involved in cell wall biosynthesis